MAGIISAANIAAAASVASTGATVAGGIKGSQGARAGGEAAAAASRYQAQIARNNAIIAKQRADYAIAAGQQRAAIQSMKGAAVAGKIKAGQAASGIDVNTGTAVDVQASQRETAQLDTETALHNSQIEAYGYRVQASNFEAEAALKDSAAGYATQGGNLAGDAALLGAGGTLLSNASTWPTKFGGKGTTTFEDTSYGGAGGLGTIGGNTFG